VPLRCCRRGVAAPAVPAAGVGVCTTVAALQGPASATHSSGRSLFVFSFFFSFFFYFFFFLSFSVVLARASPPVVSGSADIFRECAPLSWPEELGLATSVRERRAVFTSIFETALVLG
jgi:hypothetical protein